MLAPVQAINLRKSQNLLPGLAYMSHQHAEQIRNVRKEQYVCSCKPWMKTRNDRDYLHPVYRKSGLFLIILFYSFLFYSILFYSILFYSFLFYSILFYSKTNPQCAHNTLIKRKLHTITPPFPIIRYLPPFPSFLYQNYSTNP